MTDAAAETRNGGYSRTSHVVYTVAKAFIRWGAIVFFRMKVTGREHEIRRGRAIIASNHISALDPLIVGCATGRELSFLAKKELFAIPVLGPAIRLVHAHPVDRGGYSRGVLEALRVRIEADDAVLIFPEGTRHRDGVLGEGKIGVGMLAVWTGAPVTPAYVSGTYRARRAFFGRARFRVAFGPPIHPPAATTPQERKAAYQAVTDQVMAEIAKLKAATDGAAARVHHPSTASAVER